MLQSIRDPLKRVLWSRIFISPRFYSDGGLERPRGEGKSAKVRQGRIASEVRAVISQAMQQGPCQSPILQRCGFEIQRVKMSSDLRTAHVLWKALPGMEKTAETFAISQARRLRSLVFERLNMPFSPIIKFHEDKPSPEMLALDEVFETIKRNESKGESQGESESKDDSSSPLS